MYNLLIHLHKNKKKERVRANFYEDPLKFVKKKKKKVIHQ